ncbi:hypothetical protein BGZ94_008626 [Podila epigama]|nr:hypothetical protein BGZ94_008626 [Podila epigama]
MKTQGIMEHRHGQNQDQENDGQGQNQDQENDGQGQNQDQENDGQGSPHTAGIGYHQSLPQPSHLPGVTLSAQSTQQIESFSNLTEAFNAGVSIPTALFNTEAFGTVPVRTLPPTTDTPGGQTSTRFSSGVHTMGQALDDDELDFLGDDFELPVDFDDDIAMDDMVSQQQRAGESFSARAARVEPDSCTQGPSSRTTEVPETVPATAYQALEDEKEALRKMLDDLQEQLKAKDKELMVKTGENRIIKENSEKAIIEQRQTLEQLRALEVSSQKKLAELMEQVRRDLANKDLQHQFEVQNMMLAKASAPSAPKVSDLAKKHPRHTGANVPEFPDLFSARSRSRASSVRPSQRADDGFLNNFAIPSASQRYTKQNEQSSAQRKAQHTQGESTSNVDGANPMQPSSMYSSTVHLPRSALKPWSVYMIPSGLQDPSPEQTIYSKLLSRTRTKAGMGELITLKGAEYNDRPLPESAQLKRLLHLERLSKRCHDALKELTIKVHVSTITTAVKTTADLLRESIALEKLGLTRDTIRVLKTLVFEYEAAALIVSSGYVPFLEDARADPLEAVLPSESLPSALACIHFLLIGRFAQCWPSSATSLARQANASHAVLINAPRNSERKHSWILLDAPTRLPQEDSDDFEYDLFVMAEEIIRLQLRRGLSSKVIPLAHWRVFDNVLRLHKTSFRTLERALNILGVISQDPSCCRFLCGWSLRGSKWTNTFTQIETLASLLNIKAESDLENVDGVIPRIKLKATEIMRRAIRIDDAQTKMIAQETIVMSCVVEAFQFQVELCKRTKLRRTIANARKRADDDSGSPMPLLARPVESLEYRPSVFFDPWNYRTDTIKIDKSSGSNSGREPVHLKNVFSVAPDSSRRMMDPPIVELKGVQLLRHLIEFMLTMVKILPENSTWMPENKYSDHATLVVCLGEIVEGDLDLPQEIVSMAHDLLAYLTDEEEERDVLELLRH